MRTLELVSRFIQPGHVRDRKGRQLRCSFCGRSRDQVTKLVSGPGVYICDRCVDEAARIMAASTEPQA